METIVECGLNVLGGKSARCSRATERKEDLSMAAKPMTKAQIVTVLAKKNDLTKKQAAAFLESVAELAYKEAKRGFTLPGLGKLVVVSRKARWGRNPATGEKIRIAAKKVLKFRVAKAAKDAIVPAKKKK